MVFRWINKIWNWQPNYCALKQLLDDPDGYEGLVFNRWCADLEGQDIKLDWHEFIWFTSKITLY